MRGLPCGMDLGASAREAKAFVRARGVGSAQALLRLALIYGATDLSLRGTAAWAEAAGWARLSDVALLGRLQAASGWLATLASSLMTAARASTGRGGRRVRLIDATSFGREGDTHASSWRVHADYDLDHGRFVGFELTDEHEAERLTRFVTAPGDIVVGDRIYAHNAEALMRIGEAGGDFVVRRGLTSCRLHNKDGTPLDIKALLARVAYGKTIDIPVLVPIDGEAALCVRLVLHHVPEEFARRARERAAREAKGKARDKRLQAAEYVMLLTSLSKRSFPAKRLLALYRLRWQIEIAFKRLKSLVGLDQLLAKVLDSPPSRARLRTAPAGASTRSSSQPCSTPPREPSPHSPASTAHRRGASREISSNQDDDESCSPCELNWS